MLSSDNSILVGTIGSGFIKLSDSGKVLEKLNKSNGLINNTILSIFEDKNFNIWLALDDGISVINDKSPFRIFNDLDGKLGAVYIKNLRIFLMLEPIKVCFSKITTQMMTFSLLMVHQVKFGV